MNRTRQLRARRLRTWAALGLAVVVTACGVEPQDSPAPVPADRLPRATPEAASSSPAVRTRIWGVREQRVVPVAVSLPEGSAAARLQALLTLADPGQQVATALAAGTRVVSVVQRGDLVVVSVTREFRQTRDRDVPLALAQVVLTLTEERTVKQVEVQADGTTVVLVDERGVALSRPLRRTDFAGLVEGGRTD